ncbi:integrin alpha [Myxococcota bacterium]|nr:integrin alpha [Myxococcota bacterium]
MSAPWANAAGWYEGEVYLFLGPVVGTLTPADAHAVLAGEFEDGRAGASVAGAGDVDGDGNPDVIVGAPGSGSLYPDPGVQPTVYVVSGPFSGTMQLGSATAVLLGDPNGAAGTSVALAGDVDGDGRDDFLVGDPDLSVDHSEKGAAYLVPGSVSGTRDIEDVAVRFPGTSLWDGTGYAVAPAGDLDGDGTADVWVGAPGAEWPSASVGVAWGMSGASTGDVPVESALAIAPGGVAYSSHAGSLAGGADVDGDGQPDLVVGAPNAGYGSLGGGAAYLY